MARTVLTTGANSGIGLATVLELARRGFRSVGSVRSDEQARALTRAAAAAGVTVETVLLDVTDAARCQVVIDELRPWGLVNNAGYGLNGAIAAAYRRSLLGMRLWQPLMGDPGSVAAVIGRALTAWFPRARYLVGYDAQLISLTEYVVPTAVRDRIARLTLGL
jgi:NAD(P)-dependent dehydrogenase (short-subunit alcohol dehydrogenase family)